MQAVNEFGRRTFFRVHYIALHYITLHYVLPSSRRAAGGNSTMCATAPELGKKEIMNNSFPKL